jgi:hypothetical protein
MNGLLRPNRRVVTTKISSVAVPAIPAIVAWIFAVPVAMPVTVPDGETVTIEGDSDTQVTGNPVMRFFRASNALAVAWVEFPRTICAESTVTSTVLTVGGAARMVIVALPFTAPIVARIVALP